MVALIPLIFLVGEGFYSYISTSVSALNFAIILTLVVVFEIFLNSFLVSKIEIVPKNQNVIEEKPLTEDEIQFQETQRRMKDMSNEGEVVENKKVDQRTLGSTERELKHENRNEGLNEEHKEELQTAENEKTRSDLKKKYYPNSDPPVESATWKPAKAEDVKNSNEMFDWLEQNPTKGIADWKFMKAEEEKAAEEARVKRMAEERVNLVADAAGQITPSDIKRVKDALVNHWIKQIEDGEVIVVPTDETLQGMGAKDWEPRNDDKEKPKQQYGKKTNGGSPIKDFTS
jgi:hypothetical protein